MITLDQFEDSQLKEAITKPAFSKVANELYLFLKKAGCSWENDCAKAVFRKPKYPTDNNRQAKIDFWQWETNWYGVPCNRKISEGEWMEFKSTVSVTYADQISKAYQELLKAGLADEKNNGYNNYAFYLKKSGLAI